MPDAHNESPKDGIAVAFKVAAAARYSERALHDGERRHTHKQQQRGEHSALNGSLRQQLKMLGKEYWRAIRWGILWLQGAQVTIKKNARNLNNSVWYQHMLTA